MPQTAAWTIVNTRGRPIVAMLAVELWAFQRTRTLDLLLDGQHVQNVVVERTRRVYDVGPVIVAPGAHKLAFHSTGMPSTTDGDIRNRARRPVSIAVGTWNWSVRGEQP
jgi:hypothetical protein